MRINKALLAMALGQMLVAATVHDKDEQDVDLRDEPPPPDPLALPPDALRRLKGTPPNPARLSKAQRKAAKRERRTKAAT